MKAELTQSGTVLSDEGGPIPRSLDPAAHEAIKPKRVLELGQRIREEGFAVVGVGAVMNLIVCVPIMLVLCLLVGTFAPQVHFVPATFTTIYLIAYVLMLFPSSMMANSMFNEDITTDTKRDEDLIRAIRLPLLEWAVKNNCVDKIDGLDHTLALAVAHYQKVKRSS